MLVDRITLLDPIKISPFHEETDSAHTRRLAASMARLGWKGRPIVVMQLRDGTMKGLTGSHRLRAAAWVGLQYIPVIQLTNKERDAVVDSRYTHGWFDKDRQKLYGGDDVGGDAPLTEDIASSLYELDRSVPLAELLQIEDLGIRIFNKRSINRLREQDYSEEMLELL